MFAEVVVHIALGSFGLVERDRQLRKRLIEVIHHGHVGLAPADGTKVRFDEFAVAIVRLIFFCLCEVFVPGLNAAAELLDGFFEYSRPGLSHGLDDGGRFCLVVMGVDGSREGKWRSLGVLAESIEIGCLPISLGESRWSIGLSHKVLRPVQVSPDKACIIEYEEIRRLSCQFGDQSAGTFLGVQCQLNDPVTGDLLDSVDACALEVGAEKLTEGGRRRWILECFPGEVETGGFGMA